MLLKADGAYPQDRCYHGGQPLRKVKALSAKFMQGASTYLGLLSATIVVALVMVVSYETLMRFLFNNAPGWAIEIPRLMFLCVIFLGLAYATKIDAHVGLDLLTSRFSKRSQALLKAVTCFLSLGVTAILLWQTMRILVDSIREKWQTATTVPVLEWPFYVMVVLGCLVMCVEWMSKMVAGLHDFTRPSDVTGKGGTM